MHIQYVVTIKHNVFDKHNGVLSTHLFYYKDEKDNAVEYFLKDPKNSIVVTTQKVEVLDCKIVQYSEEK